MSIALATAVGTVALLALAGSAHCAAMCGGIAGALGARARTRAALVAGHAGRIAAYGFAGAVFGALGAAGSAALEWGGAPALAPVAGGLALAAVGVKLARNGRGLAFVDRFGARAWAVLARHAPQLAAGSGVRAQVLTGAAWGFMPCGMTYVALVPAAASGGAIEGAITMAVFGVATMPALLAAGALARALVALRSPRLRFAAGIAVVALGLVSTASPWLARGDAAHDPGSPHQHLHRI